MATVIISRDEARASGQRFFFTGVPCPHGHIAVRYVSSRGCFECSASPEIVAAHRRRAAILGSGTWAATMARNARKRAAQQGVHFDEAAVREVLRAPPTHCPVFGVRLVAGGKQKANSPSLDRIDPSCGYVRGNIAIISLRANAIKNDATVAELRVVAEWLAQKMLAKKPSLP